MSVTGFFHAGVTVSDMDAALRFYRDGLGLEVLSDGSASGATAAGHFCLFVDDAEAMLAKLTAAGFRSRAGEVVTINRGAHAGAKAVYMIDPDGYHVELYQRP